MSEKELTAKEIAARFAAIQQGKPDKELEQVVDDATRAELERWFGLPSFQAQAEAPAPVEDDPDIVALLARRAAAIAAVDPGLLASLSRRADRVLTTFTVAIEPRAADVSRIDFDMQMGSIAEPRELEPPPQIQDDLAERTPQALLRDLHRPELVFDKTFELVDAAAEQRLDGVAAVAEVLRTSHKLPPFPELPSASARAELAAVRAERRRSWPELFDAQPLTNRRARP